ncbi:hypothetical protein V8F06_007759 [Rhypophila decipiens]
MAVRDIILDLLRTALLTAMVIIIGRGIRAEGTTATVVPARLRPTEIGVTVARSTGTVTADDSLSRREPTTPPFSPIETRSGIHSQDENHPEGLKRFWIRPAAHVAADLREIFEVEDAAVAVGDDHGGTTVETADETANRITGTGLTLGTNDLESESETGATVIVMDSPREAADCLLPKDEVGPLQGAIFETRETSRSMLTRSAQEEDRETVLCRPVRQTRILPLVPSHSGEVASPEVDVAEDEAIGIGEAAADLSLTTPITDTAANEAALKRGGGEGTMNVIAGI